MYTQTISQDLFSYCPPLTRQPDFDAFWEKTLAAAKAVPLEAALTPYDYPSPYARVYTLTYLGADGTKVYGWYLLPAFAEQTELPCLIHYHGLGGNRGTPAEFMQWLMLGMAVISIDCRDQSGLTRDNARYRTGLCGNVTLRGIEDKEEYYYKNVYLDCIRALDFACTRPELDHTRLILEGGSQGGALTTAVSALDARPYLALPDVPSNSNITARVEGRNGSFGAVWDYLQKYPDAADTVFETLSYFDTMNMADRIRCKVFASVGLKDTTCPALHYFATYNRIESAKEIAVYPFNGHEGGHSIHNEKKLRFVAKHINA